MILSTQTENNLSNIRANHAAVTDKISIAAASVGRHPGSISLVAVSKSHPASLASTALSVGQRVFGENRVQEAQEKWPALKAEYPDAVIHLIGPLQTNKTADAVALFDVIQTLDREKLARTLAKEMERQARRKRARGCLQIFNMDRRRKTASSSRETSSSRRPMTRLEMAKSQNRKRSRRYLSSQRSQKVKRKKNKRKKPSLPKFKRTNRTERLKKDMFWPRLHPIRM